MFCCEKIEYYLNLEDEIISYIEKFDEYGIPVPDGGNSHIVISHCPWCGSRLPESKRDKWFDELERSGFENPLFDETIPVEYKTSAWFLKNK